MQSESTRVFHQIKLKLMFDIIVLEINRKPTVPEKFLGNLKEIPCLL